MNKVLKMGRTIIPILLILGLFYIGHKDDGKCPYPSYLKFKVYGVVIEKIAHDHKNRGLATLKIQVDNKDIYWAYYMDIPNLQEYVRICDTIQKEAGSASTYIWRDGHKEEFHPYCEK